MQNVRKFEESRTLFYEVKQSFPSVLIYVMVLRYHFFHKSISFRKFYRVALAARIYFLR